jgi:NAD(P)-dependent dehydrogenase (short-subunit alcohol dehydrogenase family)
MASETAPVWFITGCSTGFGLELAKLVLARGWPAVVTARDRSRVADLVTGAEDRALALSLDVTDAAQVTAAVEAAEARFGRIDVLVNNAGYGYQSSIEEGDDAEIRAQFDANVFGLFALTRAVLPGMRERRRGHVLNITSVAGFIGFPGSGYYAASKHAVEGFSDALAAEGKPLGIKVTCIEPGPFRTDWAGRSLKQDRGLCRDGGRADGVDRRDQRHAGGRPRARGRGDDPGDAGGQSAAASGPWRLRRERGGGQAPRAAGRGRGLARGGSGDGFPEGMTACRGWERPPPAFSHVSVRLDGQMRADRDAPSDPEHSPENIASEQMMQNGKPGMPDEIGPHEVRDHPVQRHGIVEY